MAVVKHEWINTQWAADGVFHIVWRNLKNGDTGEPFEHPWRADVSTQVKGTFGTGGSINWEVSNDDATPPVAFQIASDPLGNAITLTAAGLKAVQEPAARSRPNVTAGDANTDLTVGALFIRSAERG